MLSSWRGRLLGRLAILAVASIGLIGGVWLVVSSSAGVSQQRSAPGQPVSQPAAEVPHSGQPPAAEPTPPAEEKSTIAGKVVEVDLSRLSPEILQELEKTVKPIGLTEAIGIAEKSAQGRAIRAEQLGEGLAARFQVDIVLKDGTRGRVGVNAVGKVTAGVEPAATGPLPRQRGGPPGKKGAVANPDPGPAGAQAVPLPEPAPPPSESAPQRSEP